MSLQTRQGHQASNNWQAAPFDFGALLYTSTLNEIVVAREDADSNARELILDAPSDAPPRYSFATLPTSPLPSPDLPSTPRFRGSTFRPPTTEDTAVSTDKAWRRAKEKRRDARKKALLQGSSSQGHLTANPALVQRLIGAALTLPLPSEDFSAMTMPHANTSYLGLAEKSQQKDFGLAELVGEDSKYRFELRRFGR